MEFFCFMRWRRIFCKAMGVKHAEVRVKDRRSSPETSKKGWKSEKKTRNAGIDLKTFWSKRQHLSTRQRPLRHTKYSFGSQIEDLQNALEKTSRVRNNLLGQLDWLSSLFPAEAITSDATDSPRNSRRMSYRHQWLVSSAMRTVAPILECLADGMLRVLNLFR
jgi:hypothetical protein